MSVIDIDLDDMPIFMTRLVADSGCIMNGGAAQVGNDGVTAVTRSWTSWRACSRSVPGLKISSIDDSCETDFERRTSRPSTPASACSRGVVTNASTSAGDSPSEAVWISTLGGANSGKTSTGMLRNCPAASTIIPAAKARTRNRNRMLAAMIRRIIAGDPGTTSLGIADARLGPEQLGKPDDYDRGSGWWAVEQEGDVTVDPVDPHLGPNEDVLPSRSAALAETVTSYGFPVTPSTAPSGAASDELPHPDSPSDAAKRAARARRRYCIPFRSYPAVVGSKTGWSPSGSLEVSGCGL